MGPQIGRSLGRRPLQTGALLRHTDPRCSRASLLQPHQRTPHNSAHAAQSWQCTEFKQRQDAAQHGKGCKRSLITLELPVFLSMTRLKAFKLPNGSSSSLTCAHGTQLGAFSPPPQRYAIAWPSASREQERRAEANLLQSTLCGNLRSSVTLDIFTVQARSNTALILAPIAG